MASLYCNNEDDTKAHCLTLKRRGVPFSVDENKITVDDCYRIHLTEFMMAYHLSYCENKCIVIMNNERDTFRNTGAMELPAEAARLMCIAAKESKSWYWVVKSSKNNEIQWDN